MDGLLQLAVLAGIGFVGPIFWPLNPELAVTAYGAHAGGRALAAGLACATGQCALYAVLYVFAGWVLVRFERLARPAERLRARIGERRALFVPLTAAAALVGIPPAIAVPLVAPGLGARPVPVFGVLWAGRVVRYTLLAALGARWGLPW